MRSLRFRCTDGCVSSAHSARVSEVTYRRPFGSKARTPREPWGAARSSLASLVAKSHHAEGGLRRVIRVDTHIDGALAYRKAEDNGVLCLGHAGRAHL